MALTSLVASWRSLLAGHQGIVEFTFAANACEAAHAKNVMACLDRPIDPYELPLQADVHDVHVDVHSVLAVRVHRLVCLRCLGVLTGLAEHHTGRMRRTHEILLLAALAVDIPLATSWRAATT